MRPTDAWVPPDDVAASDSGRALELIDSARRLMHMDVMDLRIASWSCGGNVSQVQLVAFIEGRGALSEREYNTLAAAVNDRLIECDHAPCIPYTDD